MLVRTSSIVQTLHAQLLPFHSQSSRSASPIGSISTMEDPPYSAMMSSLHLAPPAVPSIKDGDPFADVLDKLST
jgi:hypothetical protein